jgi:hypothetical protein
MKELITEEQAYQIILALSILVTLGSLGFGFFWNSRVDKAKRKLFWANIWITAFSGPAIWIFWQFIYNPIENFYGLDSVKALGINLLVALFLGAVFFSLFYFAPHWTAKGTGSKRRK